MLSTDKRKAWSTCPGVQGAPGSECGGCGAGRPMEGHWGSEGRVLARGGLCLRQLRRHHGRHRPRVSHKSHLFSTFREPVWWVNGEGSSSWLVDSHLLSLSCHGGRRALVSSSSQGSNPVLGTVPSCLYVNLIISHGLTS